MVTFISVVSFSAVNNTNPINLAIFILTISVLVTTVVFNSSMTSWICFVIILTFSSGIITLFMYTASMTSNENTNSNNLYNLVPLTAFVMLTNTENTEKNLNESILTFSNNILIMVFAALLVFTLISISIQGHHPNQTVSTSF